MCLPAFLQIMSNGIFKSPLHRGVTNSERDRMTVATFCTPDSSRHIEADFRDKPKVVQESQELCSYFLR